MKKMMFLGLVLSVVSLGSVMANDAYAAAEGKPKKVVVNVNMPPVCGGEFHNPGGCPPPPKDGCHCSKGAPKHHKKDPRHHNGPKPRPGKKHKGKGGCPNHGERPKGAPKGGPGGAPHGRHGGR